MDEVFKLLLEQVYELEGLLHVASKQGKEPDGYILELIGKKIDKIKSLSPVANSADKVDDEPDKAVATPAEEAPKKKVLAGFSMEISYGDNTDEDDAEDDIDEEEFIEAEEMDDEPEDDFEEDSDDEKPFIEAKIEFDAGDKSEDDAQDVDETEDENAEPETEVDEEEYDSSDDDEAAEIVDKAEDEAYANYDDDSEEEQRIEPEQDEVPETDTADDAAAADDNNPIEEATDGEPEYVPDADEDKGAADDAADYDIDVELVENPEDAIDDGPDDEENLTLDDVLRRKRSSDLHKAFSLNDRFRYRRELFANNDVDMTDTLNLVETMQSYAEAEEFFYGDLQWDKDSPEVSDFMTVIKNYLSNRKPAE